MSDIKLTWNNCPHCGSEVEVESTITENVVRCTMCPARMHYDGSMSALNVMWNSRVDGWISVKDRFPKQGEVVQVYWFGKVRLAKLHPANNKRFIEYPCGEECLTKFDYKRFDTLGEITHWKPIKLPKELCGENKQS